MNAGTVESTPGRRETFVTEAGTCGDADEIRITPGRRPARQDRRRAPGRSAARPHVLFSRPPDARHYRFARDGTEITADWSTATPENARQFMCHQGRAAIEAAIEATPEAVTEADAELARGRARPAAAATVRRRTATDSVERPRGHAPNRPSVIGAAKGRVGAA
ncbi:hypothetical protein AB0L25_22210 [Spirillospora sp. NPDC052242]